MYDRGIWHQFLAASTPVRSTVPRVPVAAKALQIFVMHVCGGIMQHQKTNRVAWACALLKRGNC